MGDDGKHGSAIRRTVATVVMGLVWFILLLLWWAFWSEDYTIAQKFAVAIMSILVMGGAAGAMWIPFSMRWADEDERRQWQVRGFVWRVMATVVIFVGLAVFVVYMLFFPWKDFDLCQSLVIIIVVAIAGAVLMTPMWMRWGMRRKVTRESIAVEGVAEEISDAIEDAVEEAFERERRKYRDDDDDDDDDDD
jgi:ABC-type cobalamin transport system permease subunit